MKSLSYYSRSTQSSTTTHQTDPVLLQINPILSYSRSTQSSVTADQPIQYYCRLTQSSTPLDQSFQYYSGSPIQYYSRSTQSSTIPDQPNPVLFQVDPIQQYSINLSCVISGEPNLVLLSNSIQYYYTPNQSSVTPDQLTPETSVFRYFCTLVRRTSTRTLRVHNGEVNLLQMTRSPRHIQSWLHGKKNSICLSFVVQTWGGHRGQGVSRTTVTN